MWWLVFSLFQVTSPVEFVLGSAYLLFGVPTIPVAIAALRRPGTPGGGRTRTVLAALAGVAVVVAAVGAFVAPNDEQREGDLVLVAENFEFRPETLSADAGTIAFFLDNQDLVAHDIAVHEDDGDLDTENDSDAIAKELAPANKGARLKVDLDAGTYEFYCSIHPDMNGTLTVT
jgi:plastocyanin